MSFTITYKSPMKHFLNSLMKEAQDMERKSPEEFNKVFDIEKNSKVFRHSVNLVKTVFGDQAFFARTISNNKRLSLFKPTFNKGLIDVLMYGFTQYDQNQVMPYIDNCISYMT